MPCSACGLSKRHLFDQAALDGGYDAVVTGHNLDDEAAVLFGNALRWQTEYLGRQLPVLPARDGFPRKVKPLVRLGEREMAAYCVLRGIDYIVEECPMAAGNKHLGYKEALNAIEAQSPGAQARLLLRLPRPGRRPLRRRRTRRRRGRAALGACRRLRRRRPPTRSAPSAAWSERTAGAEPVVLTVKRVLVTDTVPSETPSARTPRRPDAPSEGLPDRSLRAGERVLLIDRKKRRYLVTLEAGGEFHTHSGFVPHDDIIGQGEGAALRSTRGATFTAFRPTLSRLRAEDAPRRAGDLPQGPRRRS